MMAVFVNCLCGGLMASAVGLSPMSGAVGLNVVAALVGNVAPAGSLCAGV